MEQCKFCRQNTYERSTNYCTTCGKPKCYFSEVLVVYGKNWSDKCSARFAITEKFLIIKKESNIKKGVTASFGIIGALVASTADPSTKSPLGYYALSEIKHIIWPYNNNKLKRNECLKIVNHDGSDLILKGELTCPMFSKIIQRFKECNVPIIDGKGKNYGYTYCEKPFVNENTLGCRVCPEAADLVVMMKENFVAPAIAAPNAEPATVSEPERKPLDETPVAVVAPSAPAPAPEPATTLEPAPETAPDAKAYKFCHECGTKLLIADKFCVGCGARQR